MAESQPSALSKQVGVMQHGPLGPQATTFTSPAQAGDTTVSTIRGDDVEMDRKQQDVAMSGIEGESGNTGAPGPGAASTTLASGLNDMNPIPPAPSPSKKDASLREFLGQMDDYAPIIPDAVTAHYLTLAGLPPPGPGPNHTPPHLARLLALATQKFIADIAADAYQYSRIRNSNSASSNNPMGSLNVAAGLGMTSTAANQGQAAAAGAGGSGAAGSGDAAKGKSGGGGSTSLHLGVQRPGFGGGGQGGGQGRTVLTMEDLGMAVAEYGVSVKRGEFYR